MITMDKKNMQFLLLIMLAMVCLTVLINGCGKDDTDMKKQIEKYRGDGAIKYLKKPGVLGRSGVAVDFQDLELSRDFQSKYNISGLPAGKDYLLYFIPSESNDTKALQKGICSYKILEEGKIVEEKTAQIADMQREISPSGSKYYFYDKGTGPRYISFETNAKKLEMFVTYKNLGNLKQGRAFFRISYGAFK